MTEKITAVLEKNFPKEVSITIEIEGCETINITSPGNNEVKCEFMRERINVRPGSTAGLINLNSPPFVKTYTPRHIADTEEQVATSSGDEEAVAAPEI